MKFVQPPLGWCPLIGEVDGQVIPIAYRLPVGEFLAAVESDGFEWASGYLLTPCNDGKLDILRRSGLLVLV